MTMKANLNDAEDGFPGVNSSASNDVGSVGSNSTKTRFSFYNAQEVQLEEQQLSSSSVMVTSSVTAGGEEEEEEEEPPVTEAKDLPENKDSWKDKDNNETTLSQKTNSISIEGQRFTFDMEDDEAKKTPADDRRSPATPAITEEDQADSTRTPAAATSIDTSTAAASANQLSTPSAYAETPQRSNHTAAQKKKQRAMAAAQARSKSSKSSSSRSSSAVSDSQTRSSSDDNHGDITLDSVEILQSLKDTEQMQRDLMKECNPNTSDNQDKQGTSDQQQDIILDALDVLEGLPAELSRPPTTRQIATPTPTSERRDRNAVQNPDTTTESAADLLSEALSQNTSRDSNPYEDAIREALDLLRKHRPPSPSEGSEGLEFDMNPIEGSAAKPLPTRTPREADRILQSRRHGSPTNHHNPEELEARKKVRQERMARYTSRLAELKNGEDNNHVKSPSCEQDENPKPYSSSSEDNEFCLPPHRDEAQTGQYSTANQNANIDTNNHPQTGRQTASDEIPLHLAGDISLGTASSLSASNYPPQNQKEVHRSVERVLLAILERAHSNGRTPLNTSGSNASSQIDQQASPGPVSDPSWQKGEEKKSSMEDAAGTSENNGDPALYTPQQQDPLLRAVGELLSSSGGGSRSSDSPPRRSQQSSVTSGGAKRSVVEELLAEAESFGGENRPRDTRNPRTTGTQSLNGEGKTENLLDSSDGVEAVRSDTDVTSVVVDKELDELVLKTLGKPSSDEETSTDEDGEDYDGEDDSRSYEEDEDGSYDDEDESCEEIEHALEGVLGPLSKNAGTTGVVLESPSSPDRSTGEKSIFDSLSNAMSSFVASAMSGDEKPAIKRVDSNSKGILRDKYATDMDHVEHELKDGQERSQEEDEEANELMRTLCAHLLPFGVDQSNRFLDEVPQWDDSNPSEPGYRIIRLTSEQLERVEIAFEAMVHGLKKESEQDLLGRDKRLATDGTFERDLAAAEKVLEEEDRTTKIMKVLNLVPETPTSIEDSRATSSDDGSASDSGDDPSVDASSVDADECHPDFPGVHTAGKGEMGDLEYFHLPVIFKSHVTGFEPTKDLVLEPGNVVAGQYLVESELGSAAFSTAYRCVDLNSEGDDTEDGHQEVCLKVIKNTKDFFDQSLDEIKILELLRQTGKCHENYIVEMRTFFYHREHLIIVTELLRQNLFEFGKFILDHDEEPYFTMSRLGYITRQVLISLRFVHKLGLVHSDVKPENILLGSYSRAQAKLIDFGSSCYLTDRQSSYIQSRSYRAPEVVLGLPYDGKIDVWSLGCVVAEMFTGEVTFQNDSIVSMLSRIEAICGPFPRHMIAQGRQSFRFFTKCGLLHEKVPGEDDGQKTPDDSDEDDDSELERGRSNRAVYDIFQPKKTTFSARLGFAPDLHDRYMAGATLSPTEQKKGMFVDFVRKMLTIDPDSRPSAAEALKHPWMVYAASLTEDDVKYPKPS